MKTLFSLLLAVALFFTSCNNAAKQQEAAQEQQQAVQQAATNAAANQQQKDQTKDALTKQIQDLQNNINATQRQIAEYNASLTTANDELNKAQNFHMLRSKAEREQQIQNAALKVNNLTLSIQNLNSNLAQYQSQQQSLQQQLSAL